MSEQKKYEMSEKWGKDITKHGFCQIPNVLLAMNNKLTEPISPLELLLLIQIISFWWKKEDNPFPSIATLAKRCGASERQIIRKLKSLESVGFLKKTKLSKGLFSRNIYDIKPLIEILKNYLTSNAS